MSLIHLEIRLYYNAPKWHTRISGSHVPTRTRYITRDLGLSLASKDRTMLGHFKRDDLLLNIHFIPEA